MDNSTVYIKASNTLSARTLELKHIQREYIAKAKLIDADNGSYLLGFKNAEQLISFYDWAREKCFNTNFGLNPYEWACYGYFTVKGEVYCLNAPKDYSGDKNWYDYSYNSRKLAEVRWIKDEKELEELNSKFTIPQK